MRSGLVDRYHRCTRDSLLEEAKKAMHDEGLQWLADRELGVTSFTARLRDLAGIGIVHRRVHVSDLWSPDSAYGIVVTAHRWALAGEEISFEARAHGASYRFYLSPLYAPDGSIAGVSGRATSSDDGSDPRLAWSVYRDAERQAGWGTWHDDLRTGQTTISDGLAELLGIQPGVGDLDLRSFDHPDDRAAIARMVTDQESSESYQCDHRILLRDSRTRSVRERVRSVLDERGVPIGRIGTLTDITDFKERESELAELALYDSLTGLPNRALLHERLGTAIARTARHKTLCAVIFIDLDGFKAINDRLGHAAGDRLLVAVAERLQRHVRATDTIARLGGDEFVVLLEDLYSEEAALSGGHKLLDSLEEPLVVDGRSFCVNASIGIAIAPRCSRLPAELLGIADREMYLVKGDGGCGVRVAPPCRSLPDVIPFGSLQSA